MYGREVQEAQNPVIKEPKNQQLVNKKKSKNTSSMQRRPKPHALPLHHVRPNDRGKTMKHAALPRRWQRRNVKSAEMQDK